MTCEKCGTDDCSGKYLRKDVVTFCRTTDEHGIFSNFAKTPLMFQGMAWPTAEHLYQALKFDDPDIRENIRVQDTPKLAKVKAHAMLEWARKDWEKERQPNMWITLVLKERYSLAFREALERTGDRMIVEATWSDSYWGAVGDYELVGCNLLGRQLVRLRNQCRGDIT